MEIVRYPDSRIEVLDERFAKYKLANAALEMALDRRALARRPRVVWRRPLSTVQRHTQQPHSQVEKKKLEPVSVFRKPSNNTNGNTRDLQGTIAVVRTRRAPNHADGIRRVRSLC